VNRSHTAFLLAAFGFVPLALGIELPSFGVDSKLVLRSLGLVAVFIAILQLRRGVNGPTTPLRWIVGLSLPAYVFRLIEPWSSDFRSLAWISSVAELAGPIVYFLIARSGITIARAPNAIRPWSEAGGAARGLVCPSCCCQRSFSSLGGPSRSSLMPTASKLTTSSR
jgi:hypothetical protein